MPDHRRTVGAWAAGAVVALAAATAGEARAELLTNGDFEDYTDNASSTSFPGWTEASSVDGGSARGTVAVLAASPLSGGRSALLTASTTAGGVMRQSIADPLTTFTFRTDFAMTDPGGETNRGFNILMRQGGNSSAQINLRVVDLNADGDGDVQVYNDVLDRFELAVPDAVDFSAALSSPVANTLSVTGDFSSANPAERFYTVTANGVVSGNLSFYQGSTTMADLSIVGYQSNQSGQASFVVDNASLVPEPSSALAVGSLGLAALARRRRRGR